MKKRDRAIIESLELFRALDRDQIAQMYYSHTKSPTTNANFALKRLRDRGYIEANTNEQPYVYFPKPARIKQDGQKVAHFLKIADFFLQLAKVGPCSDIKFFHIEPQYTDVGVRPDICMMWRGSVWFVEIQNSHYTHKVMSEKFRRYQAFHDSGKWRDLPFQTNNAPFPYVWIVADHTYKIDAKGFRVYQSKNVSDFLAKIKPKVSAKQRIPKDIIVSIG